MSMPRPLTFPATASTSPCNAPGDMSMREAVDKLVSRVASTVRHDPVTMRVLRESDCQRQAAHG